MAPASHNPGEATAESPREFAFDWARERLLSHRLFFFLALSVMGHAFCFYLFQVVYPPSEKFAPASARITLLSPHDATSQAMIREIEDRVAYFDSTSRESLGETSIDDFAIKFRPSYAEFALELKSIAAPVVAAARDPYDVPMITLPPVGPARQSASEASGEGGPSKGSETPVLVPGAGLADRPIEAPGNWKWVGDYLAELSGREVTLMLGVNSEGQPEHVLVHSGIAGPLNSRIVASARNIRFERAPGSDLQWGKVLLKW